MGDTPEQQHADYNALAHENQLLKDRIESLSRTVAELERDREFQSEKIAALQRTQITESDYTDGAGVPRSRNRTISSLRCNPVSRWNPLERWEDCGPLVEKYATHPEHHNEWGFCQCLTTEGDYRWSVDFRGGDFAVSVMDPDLKRAICLAIIEAHGG